jgi:hypothetical protein
LGQSATPTASPPSMVRDSCGAGRNHCLAQRYGRSPQLGVPSLGLFRAGAATRGRTRQLHG